MAAVAVLGLQLLSGCAVVGSTRILEDRADLVITAQPQTSDAVTVSFFGVSTLLIRDQDTALLIDGFFSRPC